MSVPPVDRWQTTRDFGYILVRSVLAFWGLMLCGTAFGGLVFHDVVTSAHPRPLAVTDFVLAASWLAMGLLHLLPFGWLARHTGMRLVLQVITVLWLGGLLVLVPRGRPIEDLFVVLLFAVPPMLATWMIARQRRRVPDWRHTAA